MNRCIDDTCSNVGRISSTVPGSDISHGMEQPSLSFIGACKETNSSPTCRFSIGHPSSQIELGCKPDLNVSVRPDPILIRVGSLLTRFNSSLIFLTQPAFYMPFKV